MSEQRESGEERLSKLAERLKKEKDAGAAPKPEKLTVRNFLDNFGYYRRGQNVISTIRKALDTYGLRTSPDFEYEYIDNEISVELDEDEISSKKDFADPTVRIGILPAAHNSPVRVAPDHCLTRATTLMRMEDYSQLPVMTNERSVRGVVSWRSIGLAYADGHNPKFVRECTEPAHIIDIDMTLTEATDQIWKHDYVLVREKDNTITGIVTAVDMANQFKQIAYPFLLIGEIEHHLRNLLYGKFTVSELKKASKDDREINGPHDLTFGGYCLLLERDEWWNRLKLNVDRKEFVKSLHDVRDIRNDVMHFSPDEHEQSEFEILEKVAWILRQLTRSRRHSV